MILKSKYQDRLFLRFGDCKTGLDRIIKNLCIKHKVAFKEYKADWKKYNYRRNMGYKNPAGILRTQEFLEEKPIPNEHYAFYSSGGKTPGTKFSIEHAIKLGIKIHEFGLIKR
jgi:hypothetical protein